MTQLTRQLSALRPRPAPLTKYAFVDEGAKVKVYVDVPPGVLSTARDEGGGSADGAEAGAPPPPPPKRTVADAGVRVEFGEVCGFFVLCRVSTGRAA